MDYIDENMLTDVRAQNPSDSSSDQKMTLTPIRRRLQLSNVSDYSMNSSAGSCGMEVEFASGVCENLAPGIDARDRTNTGLASTPVRNRSASSPFSSPAGIAQLGKIRSPAVVSPLLGTSPTQGLKRHGFMVIRKRRSTFNDRIAERKKRTSSPLKPFIPCKKQEIKSASDDYVLREDNLCSMEDGKQESPINPFKSLSNNEIIIKRPRLKMSQRRNSVSRPAPDRGVNDSPISFRAKRCLSLKSPGDAAGDYAGGRDLRTRKKSVNDFNLPHEDNLKSIDPLMDRADLVGDFSRQLSLPVTTCGRHSDLKYISTQTMVDLLQGKIPVDFFVVDARYPYEYNGGHIRGAKNLFTREAIQNHFYGANPFFSQNKENQSQDTARRQIIIFHCEFSVERGPAMLKHLRKLDRSKNRYPTLDYPEIYLLKGGYKQFFHDHKEATTGTYAPMLDTKYTQELRHFRRKCKTLPAGKLSL